MNIARRSIAFPLLSLAVASLFCGCQGLQGIRYHQDDFEKLTVEDGSMGMGHDAGFEVGNGGHTALLE